MHRDRLRGSHEIVRATLPQNALDLPPQRTLDPLINLLLRSTNGPTRVRHDDGIDIGVASGGFTVECDLARTIDDDNEWRPHFLSISIGGHASSMEFDSQLIDGKRKRRALEGEHLARLALESRRAHAPRCESSETPRRAARSLWQACPRPARCKRWDRS